MCSSDLEIGYLAGVPRQRVNQALKMMSEAGLIGVRYGAIEVLDLPALERFKASLAHSVLNPPEIVINGAPAARTIAASRVR